MTSHPLPGREREEKERSIGGGQRGSERYQETSHYANTEITWYLATMLTL
jgi:hypothetical protein